MCSEGCIIFAGTVSVIHQERRALISNASFNRRGKVSCRSQASNHLSELQVQSRSLVYSGSMWVQSGSGPSFMVLHAWVPFFTTLWDCLLMLQTELKIAFPDWPVSGLGLGFKLTSIQEGASWYPVFMLLLVLLHWNPPCHLFPGPFLAPWLVIFTWPSIHSLVLTQHNWNSIPFLVLNLANFLGFD